ncbi:hypothetical protein U1Q18_051451 [Sarracenia purpurea var. burkii]
MNAFMKKMSNSPRGPLIRKLMSTLPCIILTCERQISIKANESIRETDTHDPAIHGSPNVPDRRSQPFLVGRILYEERQAVTTTTAVAIQIGRRSGSFGRSRVVRVWCREEFGIGDDPTATELDEGAVA